MNSLTPKQIASVIKIENPLNWCIVTQGWGVNYVDFYTKLGLKGHNGIDLRAERGTPTYAVAEGEVLWAGEYAGYGINVHYKTDQFSYNGVVFSLEFIYGHLNDVSVKAGDRVMAGTVLGHTDNTGKYTTADHLHFGVRPNYMGRYENNGNNGWIDPSELFEDRGWNYTPVEKRYGKFYKKEDPSWRPWKWYLKEKQVGFDPYIIKFLKRLANNNEIKAMVYGDWSLLDIANPALYATWAAQTKEDFLAKKPRPIRLIG